MPLPRAKPGKPPVIGLTGGIGSGKSEVARMLAELGAVVIDSDADNRQVLAEDEVKGELRRWWGDRVFTSTGEVDRRAVAEIVFSSPPDRERLEALLHPRIDARRIARMAAAAVDPGVRLVVIDAPLLFEAGLDRACDAVVFVDAAEARRRERVAGRGWDVSEWRRRENQQWPLDKKRAMAQYICDNNSDVAALRRHVEAIFSQIVPSTEIA